MLFSHLVYSRPLGPDEHETHYARPHDGWLTRLIGSLRRRKTQH